jgi:hypothetical protein
VEAAAARAIASGAMTYRSIHSILKHGLDHAPIEPAATTRLPPTHDNVRGAAYYADTTEPQQLSLITGDV